METLRLPTLPKRRCSEPEMKAYLKQNFKTKPPQHQEDKTEVAGAKDDITTTTITYASELKDKPPPLDTTINTIRPYLFLSGLGPLQNPEALEEHGITHILSVIDWHHFRLTKPIPRGISHLLIRANDYVNERLGPHFNRIAEFVRDARMSRHDAKVLVHCYMGRSRSVAAVLATLMMLEDVTLDEAWDDVRAARPVVHPNSGFLLELRLLERSLFGEVRSVKALTEFDKWAPEKETVGKAGGGHAAGR
jgi:predicted protein tyrosine phosphatase